MTHLPVLLCSLSFLRTIQPLKSDFSDLLTRGFLQVLQESVRREEMTEQQAIEVAQRALFHNANRLYGLDLKPDLEYGYQACGSTTF